MLEGFSQVFGARPWLEEALAEPVAPGDHVWMIKEQIERAAE